MKILTSNYLLAGLGSAMSCSVIIALQARYMPARAEGPGIAK